jgi:hypothetical protein
MKKATAEDFLTLLDDFKLSNNITDTNFDYYATLKFCRSTFLNDFYDISLVKTDSQQYPILLQMNGKALVFKMKDANFAGISEDEIKNVVPFLTKKDYSHVSHLNTILKESTSFKSFVDNINTVFGEGFDLHDLSGVSKNIMAFNIADTLNTLVKKLKDVDVKDYDIKYSLQILEDDLSSDIFIGRGIDVSQMSHDFKRYVSPNQSGYSGDTETYYDSLMEKYYKHLDQYFDLFKFQQTLKTGIMLNSTTDEKLLDTPLLNEFITIVKANQPTWFQSFDESMVHSRTDDNAIRAAGTPLIDKSADFDLINSILCRASVYPSTIDGYTNVSEIFMKEDTNSVHLYGDNVFFKPYYHNLIIKEKENLNICTYIHSEMGLSLSDDMKFSFLLPVLDYLEKNKIILDLADSNDYYLTFLNYIKKEDLSALIKEKYPNLIFLNFDKDLKKSIEISHATSFKDALKIYKQDEKPTPKTTKLKNAL